MRQQSHWRSYCKDQIWSPILNCSVQLYQKALINVVFINQWFCCAILCKTNGLRSSLSFGRIVRILPSNDMEVMFVSVDMIVASDVWTWEEVRKLVPRTDPERKHFIRICLSISLIMSSSLIFCAGLIRKLIVFPNLTLQFTIIMLLLN